MRTYLRVKDILVLGVQWICACNAWTRTSIRARGLCPQAGRHGTACSILYRHLKANLYQKAVKLAYSPESFPWKTVQHARGPNMDGDMKRVNVDILSKSELTRPDPILV